MPDLPAEVSDPQSVSGLLVLNIVLCSLVLESTSEIVCDVLEPEAA